MKTLITAALLLTALLAANAHAVIITAGNATAYGNPFTGSTNTIGVNSGGGTVTQGFSIDNVVSQQDCRQRRGNRAHPGRDRHQRLLHAIRGRAPFTAGTVITSQNVGGGFFSPMSYNIQLDGGSPVQSGAGLVGSTAINVTTLASKQTVQTLRVNEAMSTFNGTTGTHYGDMNEVLILPDRLAVVPSTASATGTIFGSAAGLNDLQGGDNYWGGSNGSSVTLTFSRAETISALVLVNLETVPGSSAPLTFNILDSLSNLDASVSMSENNSTDEFVGIKFNTPVTTSFLKFNFTNAGNAGMLEIIPLEAPEPASLGLLAVGGLALLKRRR